MGVHFKVLVDHNIRDTSLDAVRARFAPLMPIFEELRDRTEQEPAVWKEVSESGSVHPYLFYTPGGFTLNIGSAALALHHFTRFSTFIEAGTSQDLLRRFSRQLAQLFGQHRALYFPCEGVGDEITDWMTDGLSLEVIEAHLRQRGNPPATFAELESRSFPGPRYYIDEF
jgi:hypothetical protein